jgi:hypothetical protein
VRVIRIEPESITVHDTLFIKHLSFYVKFPWKDTDLIGWLKRPVTIRVRGYTILEAVDPPDKVAIGCPTVIIGG